MNIFTGEIVGTFLLILLGDGVVANVVLDKTKGNNSGWIVITFGWAIAVFLGVNAATSSKAHLNPAVTIAFAALGKFDWSAVPTYIAAQLIGAMVGSSIVWLMYRRHFDETKDPGLKLAA